MQLDPVITLAASLMVAAILASAAAHKVFASAKFRQQLEDYQLVHHKLVKPIALLLPRVEGVIAFCLLIPVARAQAATAAAVLFAVYAGAISINLWRGRRDIDCGCDGAGYSQPLRPVLLARNAVLVGVAILAGVLPVARDLGWLDGFICLAASAVALLLYSATDGLMANSPRLNKLIGR